MHFTSIKLITRTERRIHHIHLIMNAPKYNKFNTGKTAGYFPFKRWRFDTEKHPIIQSKERCASSTTKTKFSTQELQMLVGLTNTLQCKEREAIPHVYRNRSNPTPIQEERSDMYTGRSIRHLYRETFNPTCIQK